MVDKRNKYSELTNDSYERLLATFQHSQFLDKKGLANDLPFFICPYDPAFENRASELRGMFSKELRRQGLSILDVNLYDILTAVLKADGYFEMLLEREGSIDPEEFLEIIQNLASPEQRLVPTIFEMVKGQSPKILFLSGLGEVYPFIKPHSILSHLQAQLSEQLTVMFFPGKYSYSETSGATLDIFGLRQEERYYRAFNIFEYEV